MGTPDAWHSVLLEAKPTALPIAFAASHHAVAVRQFNEAAIHLSARENAARLVLAFVSVPSVDVREVPHLLTPVLKTPGPLASRARVADYFG